jgi:hypothetical protein
MIERRNVMVKRLLLCLGVAVIALSASGQEFDPTGPPSIGGPGDAISLRGVALDAAVPLVAGDCLTFNGATEKWTPQACGGNGNGQGPAFILSTPETLSAALATCSNCTLLVATTLTAPVSATVPTTTALQFLSPGALSISSGATVDFQGSQVDAGLYQIFSGAGHVVNLPVVSPEWFGAISSASTISAAAAACLPSGCTMNLQGAAYNFGNFNDVTPMPNNNISIVGTQRPIPATTTGTASNGSTALTVASGTGLGVGQSVNGNGIAAGTVVSAVSGTSVTLSLATTAALSSTPLTFIGTVVATTTGTASTGSATLTVASATGLFAGQTVACSGVPAGDVVTAISGTTITLTLNTTAALSGTPCTFLLPGSIVNPSFLTAGSVMLPSFTWSGNNVSLAHLGVDNGSATSATALNVLHSIAASSVGYGISMEDVVGLGNSVTSTTHNVLLGNYQGVHVHNLWGYRAEDGIVTGGNGTFEDIHEFGHTLACLYVKANGVQSTVLLFNVTVNNVTCQSEVTGDTEFAVNLQSLGATLANVAIDNLTAYNTQFGVNFIGDTSALTPIQDVSVGHVTLDNLGQSALVVNGFVNNVDVGPMTVTNSGSWIQENATDPNVTNFHLHDVVADASSGAGCLNEPAGEFFVYNSPTLTNSNCPAAQFSPTVNGTPNQIDLTFFNTPVPTVKLDPAALATQWFAGTSTGSGTAYSINMPITPAALATGQPIGFLPILANTSTTPTLNVSGIGALTIVKCGSTPLATGDLTTSAIAYVVFTGSVFQLLNPQLATCQTQAAGSWVVNNTLFISNGAVANSPTGNTTITGGQNSASSSALGNAQIIGGTNTGTGPAGNAFTTGGNTSGVGAAGSAFLQAGKSSGGGQQGLAQVSQAYTVAAALSATFEVVSMTTTADQVQAAALAATNNIGIAQAVGGAGTAISVVTTGKTTVRFDGTPVVGDFACAPPASTGTVGLAHDNGATACPASQKLGIVTGQVAGTGSGATATVQLELGS